MSAQHLDYAVSNSRSVSYLSHDTQNEFIELMGNAVCQHIIEEIRQAKYFSIVECYVTLAAGGMYVTLGAGHVDYSCVFTLVWLI